MGRERERKGGKERERERERKGGRIEIFSIHCRFQLVDFGLAHLESEKHGSHSEQKGTATQK